MHEIIKQVENLFYKEKKHQEAFDILEEHIKRDRFNAGLYTKLSQLKRKYFIYQLSDTIKILRRALRIRPVNIAVYNELGILYQLKGDFKASEKILKEAIKLKPKHIQPYSVLATTYKKSGDFSKALVTINQGLVYQPRNRKLVDFKKELEKEKQTLISSSQIQDLIADGKTDEALKKLDNIMKNKITDLYNDFILFQNQWKEIQKKINLNTISDDKATIQKNKITHGILELLKEISN